MDAVISDFPQGSRFPAVSGKRPVPVLNLLTPGRCTEFLFFYREKGNAGETLDSRSRLRYGTGFAGMTGGAGMTRGGAPP